jgi:hypothetical protein
LVDDYEQHFFERAVSMVGSEFLKSNRLLSLERAGKPQNRERFLRIYASLCHGH